MRDYKELFVQPNNRKVYIFAFFNFVMANEAVMVRETALPVTYTSATAMEKGTIVKLSDNNVVAASSATGDVIAGILARETLSTDTEAAVYEEGDFRVYASGSITTGNPVGVITGYPNYVYDVSTVSNLSGQQIVGYAREDATNGTQFLIKLNPMHGA